VVLVPAVMLIEPPARIPNVSRGVLAASEAVPVPVAGSGFGGGAGGAVDDPDAEEDVDEDAAVLAPAVELGELLDPPLIEASALCTAALS